MPVQIVRHMKAVIVVVVNHVHNGTINLKDNNNQLIKQVVSNKVVKLGELKQEMRIKTLVVIVAVVAEAAEIMKAAEVAVTMKAAEVAVTMKAAEVAVTMKAAEVVVIMKVDEVVVIMKVDEVVEVMKAVEAVAEAVVVVDAAILTIEILKKVHSNNNRNNHKHKKAANGNKAPSMCLLNVGRRV